MMSICMAGSCPAVGIPASGRTGTYRRVPARYALRVHRIAVLALDDVVAFDLSIPAQVFGHHDERDRYTLTVCGRRAGPVRSSTGFEIVAARGLGALGRADTIIIPGIEATAPEP